MDTELTTTSAVRKVVVITWSAGLIVCALIFAIKFFGLIDLMAVDQWIVTKGALSILGFLIPPVEIMLFALLSDSKNTPKVIEKQKAKILIIMSIVFQLVIVSLVVYGFLFLGFDKSPTGSGVLNNTSVILLIAGVFSFMGFIPVNYLFK